MKIRHALLTIGHLALASVVLAQPPAPLQVQPVPAPPGGTLPAAPMIIREMSGEVLPDVPSGYYSSGANLPEPPCTACQFCGTACGPSGHCGKCRSRWETEIKPRLQASHWGYCDQFCERPFGSLVNAHLAILVENGIQQQMALYAYDFHEPPEAKAARLNSRGHYQLTKLAILLQQGYGPLMIEQSGDEMLDRARRGHVLAALRAMDVEVVPQQVVLRRRPRQLTGEEALPIYGNNLDLIRSRGQSGGGSATGRATRATTIGTGR